MLPESIGPYRVLERLGAGGMGEVFLAEDPRLGRRVAIKRPTGTAAGAVQLRERLRREAHAAAQLNHPNVAAIYDVLDHGDPDPVPHIVMEYVDGETLAAVVRRGPLQPEAALAIARQVADALVEAHAHGVIHRDLKPANVMIAEGGRVKVLDFGLAPEPIPGGTAARNAPSVASQIYGTPGYMAPEQVMGLRGDARSDVFGFGALLYELVTGEAPFKGTDHLERVLAGLAVKPPEPRDRNPQVPAALNDLVARALAFRPEDRFQSAESLRGQLARVEDAISEAPTAAVQRAGAPPRPARRFSRRLMIFAVAVVAVGVALTAWRYWPARSRTGSSPVVAVLPFEVPAGGSELESLGAGLADMIINSLAGSEGITAVPPSASRGYVNREARGLDSRRIARDLGASHLVDGSLRQTADGIELTVRVVRVQEGKDWTRSYPGTLEDALTLGRRLLGDVVVELGAASPPQTASTSVEAFQQYSQGRGLLDRRDVPGNVDRAIELLSAAVKRDEGFALAHAALGEAYIEKYRQTRERQWVDRGEQEILVALSADANQPLVRYSLATVLHETGRSERAEQELRTILRTAPLDSAHRLLGIVLAGRGHFDEARDEFQRAINLRPGYWANYGAKGSLELRTGRYAEAEQAFLRVVELQPDNADAYANLGTVYLLTNQRQRAIEQFRRSIRAAPTVSAWSNLGNALTDDGQYEAALDAFRQAAALRPRDPVLQRNHGDALARLHRTAEARAAYEEGARVAREALEVNPRSADSHGTLAICLAKLRRFDEALKHIEQAVALSPDSYQPYYRRAAVLALAGRGPDAIRALQDAMKRGLSRAMIAHDEDFASLRNAKEFQQLVTPQP